METVERQRGISEARTHRLSQLLYRYGAVLTIGAVIVFFSIVNEHFFTYGNLTDILKSISIVTFLALGVTFSLVVDGFDVSVGSTASLATIAAASMLVLHRQELLVALLVPLLCGVAVGLLNALLAVKLRLPDLLATLAVMYVVNGIHLTCAKGYSIYEGMPAERLRRAVLVGGRARRAGHRRGVHPGADAAEACGAGGGRLRRVRSNDMLSSKCRAALRGAFVFQFRQQNRGVVPHSEEGKSIRPDGGESGWTGKTNHQMHRENRYKAFSTIRNNDQPNRN